MNFPPLTTLLLWLFVLICRFSVSLTYLSVLQPDLCFISPNPDAAFSHCVPGSLISLCCTFCSHLSINEHAVANECNHQRQLFDPWPLPSPGWMRMVTGRSVWGGQELCAELISSDLAFRYHQESIINFLWLSLSSFLPPHADCRVAHTHTQTQSVFFSDKCRFFVSVFFTHFQPQVSNFHRVHLAYCCVQMNSHQHLSIFSRSSYESISRRVRGPWLGRACLRS